MADVRITQNFARPSYRPAAPASGLDPDMRRMAMIAGGLGVGLALIIGAFSLSHRVHHGVPVIEPEPGPVRVKPLDPGGMKVAGAEDIASSAERLAPEPEKPALHALRAKTHVAKPAPTPAPIPAPAPAPMVAAAPPAPVRAEPPLAPAPAGGEVVDSVQGPAIQLAAFESQQAAEQDWGKLAEKIPGLFNGHAPHVIEAKVAGHTVYRLRTGGFANIAAATEFCMKVRAGGGDCSLASF
jgi:hypothetical protein